MAPGWLERLRTHASTACKRVIAREGRWPRLVLFAAFVAVLGMYCTNTDMNGDPRSPRGDGVYRPVLARGDGHMMYLMARSTALDGDWVFDNDLARFGDPWRQPRSATGRKEIPHPVGPPLLWTPLIWIAQGGAAVANAFGAGIAMHGYTLWHQRFVFLSSVLAACAAVLLGRKLAMRTIGGAWSSAYAAVAVLLGTSLTYYATYMPSYGHALDALACAVFLAYWAATTGRVDRRRWIVLGIALGAAMLIRMQDLALGIVLVVEAVFAVWRSRTWKTLVTWLLGGLLVLAVAAVVFMPQFIYWRLVYGAFLSMPQGARYTRFGSPMILELLYSARNGWFSTTPIAYAAVIGLFCLPRRARLIACGLGAAVAIQVYLNSTIMDWWGMASFGARRMCSVTLPLVVGLAALLWRLSHLARKLPVWARHAAVIAVFGSFIAWNVRDVGKLRHGVAAPAELVPTCCGHVPHWLRPTARWVFDRVGNPFQFPANALFAIRHGVPVQRWDAIVGNYPIIPPADTLRDDRLWRQRGTFKISDPGAEPYLVGGFSGSLAADRRFRWTIAPVAKVLIPNLMPYHQRMRLWIAPGGSKSVEVAWDGEVVARRDLAAGWNPIELELDHVSVGEHELEIRAPLGPCPSPGTWPPPPWLVAGVAVGVLEIQLVGP